MLDLFLRKSAFGTLAARFVGTESVGVTLLTEGIDPESALRLSLLLREQK